MIVIIIIGILFGLGSFYFISLFQEHRISVQNVFLRREASYAMDFIINGRMGENDQGVYYRYDGIIGSHHYKLSNRGSEIDLYRFDPNEAATNGVDPNIDTNSTDPNIWIGRIYADPNYVPPTLFFEDSSKEKHRIIPVGLSETEIQDPYQINIRFTRDDRDNNLIYIELRLEQTANKRSLGVDMFSKVRLRNYP